MQKAEKFVVCVSVFTCVSVIHYVVWNLKVFVWKKLKFFIKKLNLKLKKELPKVEVVWLLLPIKDTLKYSNR